jgi:hypothetical protein
MQKRPYPRYRRRHDALLLTLFENPLQTNKEIAKATGYTPSQVSRIVCSPDFRALYEVMMHEAASHARTRWLAHISATGASRQWPATSGHLQGQQIPLRPV